MKINKRLIFGLMALLLLWLMGCAVCTFGPETGFQITTALPPHTPTPVIIVVTPTPVDEETIAEADAEEQLIINIYARVSPSVVFIDAINESDPLESGSGSGFIFDTQGHIVTNNHVVAESDRIMVTLADETTVRAEVVGTDPSSDLAVLKIEAIAELLHPVELGESKSLRVGQRAIAIGNPFGLDRTITTGVISSLRRTLDRRDSGFRIAELIQTDAAINPGNSGGPLLDSNGKVIGINTAIFSQSGTSSGVGMAVPVDMIRRVVPNLIESGHYSHPWLGVTGQTITPELRETLDLPVAKGVLIFNVEEGGPAEKAGLHGGDHEMTINGLPILAGGDILTSIQDIPIKKFDDLINYLARETRVNDVVVLIIIRDSKEHLVKIRLEGRPTDR